MFLNFQSGVQAFNLTGRVSLFLLTSPNMKQFLLSILSTMVKYYIRFLPINSTRKFQTGTTEKILINGIRFKMNFRGCMASGREVFLPAPVLCERHRPCN